ncbi:hypothetical protein AC1031_009988 [Aphanomyces cochlioides]|nr:hypothetical protein AC1031_009988 [Aphanomyces cochlioides]
MDSELIESLRQDLRTVERNAARDGRLREFVTKPTKLERIHFPRHNDDDATAVASPPCRMAIRRRDSFATAVIKRHCGIDPMFVDDEEPSNNHQRPASAAPEAVPASPKKVTVPVRPATVHVSSQRHQRRRSFESLHREEKANVQGRSLPDGLDDNHRGLALETQFTTIKDILIRHFDRLCQHGRPDYEVSHAVYMKLHKFDDKMHIEHAEGTITRKSTKAVTAPARCATGQMR